MSDSDPKIIMPTDWSDVEFEYHSPASGQGMYVYLPPMKTVSIPPDLVWGRNFLHNQIANMPLLPEPTEPEEKMVKAAVRK